MKRSFRLLGLDHYDLEGSIGEVISKLQKFQNKHPSAVLSLEAYDNYGSPNVELNVTETREETDEERISREKEEARRAKHHEAYERRQYEALRAKFGDE